MHAGKRSRLTTLTERSNPACALPTVSCCGGSRSEERRGGKESRYWRDWSSDVCSSDLGALAALVRYMRRPSAATYDRFSRQVFFDPDHVRSEGGDARWETLEAYHIDRTIQPSVRAANRQLLRRIQIGRASWRERE